VAVAKRDLKAGGILDGEGGYTVAGQLRPASITVANNCLPLGLTGGLQMLRDVNADEMLKFSDVKFDASISAFKLYENNRGNLQL